VRDVGRHPLGEVGGHHPRVPGQRAGRHDPRSGGDVEHGAARTHTETVEGLVDVEGGEALELLGVPGRAGRPRTRTLIVCQLAHGPTVAAGRNARPEHRGDHRPVAGRHDRMFTARAATSATVTSAEADWAIISAFDHVVSGMVSVGLNAVEFVNDVYR
jgi:hypothetical protein